jgi:hypothetical protein
MDTAAYAAEAVLEENHWWYVGRRALFSDTIKTVSLGRYATRDFAAKAVVAYFARHEAREKHSALRSTSAAASMLSKK